MQGNEFQVFPNEDHFKNCNWIRIPNVSLKCVSNDSNEVPIKIFKKKMDSRLPLRLWIKNYDQNSGLELYV